MYIYNAATWYALFLFGRCLFPLPHWIPLKRLRRNHLLFRVDFLFFWRQCFFHWYAIVPSDFANVSFQFVFRNFPSISRGINFSEWRNFSSSSSTISTLNPDVSLMLLENGHFRHSETSYRTWRFPQDDSFSLGITRAMWGGGLTSHDLPRRFALCFSFLSQSGRETETEMENYITDSDPFLLTVALPFFFNALNAFVHSTCVGHATCTTSGGYALVGNCGWLDRILKLFRRVGTYLLATETMNYSTSGTISRQTCRGIYLRERHRTRTPTIRWPRR